MAIVCPYCNHGMAAKGLRAGRFSPKCPKCGESFVLQVALDPEPSYKTAKRPAPKAPARADDPGVTAAPGEMPRNADFSVGASIVRSMHDKADKTRAIETPAAPPRRKTVRVSGTDAGDEDEPKAPARQRGDEEESLTGTLGGYHIERELGRGGMGAVYLARQVSLDRSVALKVMNTRWASNPNFLVRFTREAYAAAQLAHHNVVQVYDIGAERGINFFSMEFVEGQSLGDLLREQGPVAPETAAGYILQAARGLKFAHDRGMIHRDVKPDNLMLNNQGVVKVADLGLVRTPGSVEAPANDVIEVDADVIANRAVLASQNATGRTLNSLNGVTRVGQAMGTPSYMAPEQAHDATSIDHRADVYSLGCTLFVLLTARHVFEATTPLEMMTKHAAEQPIRPESLVKEVPRALSDITLRMLAKKPDDRYASMDEVIKAMEDFLGLQGAARQATSEAHVRTLEQGCKAFEQVPAARLRSMILLGFFGVCAALFLGLVLFGYWKLGGFFLGLGVLTATAYGFVRGSSQRSPVFLKLRDWVLSSGYLEMAKMAVAGLLFVGFLYLVGLLWVWLVALSCAIALALGLFYALDRRIAAAQAEALDKVEHMLKTLRLRGLSEEALQEFVAKYAGDHWEEVFEALFGYEAKMAARATFGRGPKGLRPRHAAWRDGIVRAIDRLQRGRQEARERSHLQKVEQKGLEAQGVGAAEAKEQAQRVAEAMVQKAADLKKDEGAAKFDPTVLPEHGIDVTSPAAGKAVPKRANVQDVYMVIGNPDNEPIRRKPILPVLLSVPFGSTTRFFVSAVLLGLCLLWMSQRNLLPSSTNLDDETVYLSIWERMKTAAPLELPGVPAELSVAVSSINAGLAGALLLLSIIWRSWKIGFWTLLGAAIMVLGPVSGHAPEVGPLTPGLVCLAGGGLVMAAGFLFGRDT